MLSYGVCVWDGELYGYREWGAGDAGEDGA